jgi:hypothetical protein
MKLLHRFRAISHPERPPAGDAAANEALSALDQAIESQRKAKTDATIRTRSSLQRALYEINGMMRDGE